MPRAEKVVEAQREKAAALGANALLIEQGAPRRGLFANAFAIFVPADSARAYAMCAAH